MDPNVLQPGVLQPAGWALIGATIARLTVFVVLVILGAFSLLLSRAVLPSLIATHQIEHTFDVHRRVLVAVGVVAFALAIFQLVRVIDLLIAVLQPYYPRWGF